MKGWCGCVWRLGGQLTLDGGALHLLLQVVAQHPVQLLRVRPSCPPRVSPPLPAPPAPPENTSINGELRVGEDRQ
jgi:hypothetical protein